MVQVFVLPYPEGWAVVTYGDPVIPDDEVIPLPLTSSVTYDEALAFVRALPMASDGFVDGWDSIDSLRALEPELAARVSA